MSVSFTFDTSDIWISTVVREAGTIWHVVDDVAYGVVVIAGALTWVHTRRANTDMFVVTVHILGALHC